MTAPSPPTASTSVQRQKYAEFLRSPHLLSRIFDIAEDAIISIDQSHQIVMFNQGAEKMFGFQAREVLGQPLDILLPPGFAGPHRGHVSAFGQSPIAARRMGERGQIAGRRKDGSEFPAEASISK
jgi:PAS domain S-box-containing protein